MIKTKDELILYIKEELGYPQLNIELTDKQISHCIEKSIQMFTNFAYDGELIKYIKFECEGRGNYFVDPNIEEITNICQSTIFTGSDTGAMIDQNLSNYILNTQGVALSYLVTLSSTRSLIDRYFGKGLSYSFNSHKGILSIFEDYFGPVLLECYCRYVPDEFDKIYDQEWVKAMSVAQTRLQQSVVLGKYSHNLVNGAQINYSDIRSMAEAEIEKLTEELKERWTEPAPIMIG